MIRASGFPLPFEKFRQVGVAGKPVDGVNARPHRDVLVKNAHSFGAVDDLPRQGAHRRLADEHDAALRAPQIMLEVVADPASGGHA